LLRVQYTTDRQEIDGKIFAMRNAPLARNDMMW
jgi:hypothetical protein